MSTLYVTKTYAKRDTISNKILNLYSNLQNNFTSILRDLVISRLV